MIDSSWRLVCALCHSESGQRSTGRCPACSGPVLAERTEPMTPEVDDRAPGIYRWRHRLGLPEEATALSLGEGNTPLVSEPRLAAEHGVGEVLLKLDSLCPTGSFKDRSIAAATADAVRSGARGLVCASSGNAAASTAAYGARAGLPTVLLTPTATPRQKLAASAVYGATQLVVPGDYSNAYRLALEIERELDLTNVATTYVNPHVVLGLRSVAYELAAEHPGGVDVVIVPTSAGPLVHGVLEGFRDLYAIGHVDRVPRMVAAQPAGCAPIVRAFDSGAESVQPWEQPDTMVSGLNDPLRGYADDGTVTLRCVRDSGGAAVALEDQAIAAAQTQLAERFGILAEPAASTAVAALAPLSARGVITPADTVVCLLTGHGSKQPPGTPPAPIEARELGDVADHLQKLLAGA